MTTRTYYLPRNRISLAIINKIIDKIGCSIGDLKVMKVTDTVRVPITCNDSDVQKIEKILKTYNMMGE